MPFTIRLHRVLRASPALVYRAFTDPHAFAKWLPPDGYVGQVHEMNATVGGRWRMSFTQLATGHSHAFGGEYLELQPHRRIRYSSAFDDPHLPGTMQTTVTLDPVPGGADVAVVQEGIPDVIPVHACHLGWQDSLALLQRLTEGAEPAERAERAERAARAG